MENRLGVRQEMIVMGLIIAAVISVPRVGRIMVVFLIFGLQSDFFFYKKRILTTTYLQKWLGKCHTALIYKYFFYR